MVIVGQLPLFVGLSHEESLLVAGSSLLTEYKKGETIYAYGDAADAFYCVVTGRVKVFLIRSGGTEEVLEYLTRGKYFGILSLLTGEPHSVTAKAVNDSVLLKIRKEQFEKMMEKIPRIALHVSQTLSRRLRRKDVPEKRIFESTIIAVRGCAENIGATTYAVNLATALTIETKKNVVMVAVTAPGRHAAKPSGAHAADKPVLLDSPFFREDEVASAIVQNATGLGMINILFSSHDAARIKALISLLSYLTREYHFIVVDLSTHMGSAAIEIAKQSDFVHIITSQDHAGLDSAAKIAGELGAQGGVGELKVKVITAEYGPGPHVPADARMQIIGRSIFATLPDIKDGHADSGSPDGPRILSDPQCTYSRAIRRIARQMGDALVGLALGSGAALGLAHIGVVRILEREGIPIDIVVGTSMGALIGGLWASGMNADAIEKALSRYRSKLETIKLMDFTFPRRGIIKGNIVRNFLRAQFGRKTFYDLKLPFKAVACDIQTRQEVVIETGLLADAVLASISIPGVFEPVKMGDAILVDGGIINPLPTNVLSRMGVKKIIAVNTLPSLVDVAASKKKVTNIFDIIVNSAQASEYILAEISSQNADITLHPVVPTMDWYEFYESRQAIRRGEEEVMAFLPEIKELVSQ